MEYRLRAGYRIWDSLTIISEILYGTCCVCKPTTKAKFTVVYLGKEMCSLVLTPDEYTANQKVISEYKNTLINHFQCKDWEEVVASKSQDDIAAALRDLT